MELHQLNGLSRISPTSEPMYMQGLSRINYLNGYSLNAYQLNAYMLNGLKMANYGPPTRESMEDFVCYCEDSLEMGIPISAQGYGQYMMQGKAERQQRRARRRAKRETRQQMKMDKRSRRARKQEARTSALERGEGFFQKLGQAAEGLGQRALGLGEEWAGGVMDEFEGTMLPEVTVMPPEDSGRGYLLGKPPFEPWTGRWWQSSRVPMWQKAAVGVGGLIVVDKVAFKGKYTKNLPIIGKI